MDYLVPGY